MKKVLTLVAAVVLFATAAMAETITLTGHKSSKIQAEGMVQYDLTAGGMEFYFCFNVTDVTVGQTYTYADMVADYTWVDDGVSGLTMTAASFVKVDEDNYTASATCSDGNTYNITIAPLTPITDPKATVTLTIDKKATTRLVDAVASQGIFQFLGETQTGDYYVYMAIQNATQIAGNYNESDLHPDYTMVYAVNGDDYTEIELNNILGTITVTDNGGSYTANMRYVGTDSVEYNVTFTYADPVATTQKTFQANNLQVQPNENYDLYALYYSVYPYDFMAYDAEYLLAGTFYGTTEDPAGAYDYEDGYLDVAFYDANTQELSNEWFSGAATLTVADGGAATVTGTAIVYGDIEFTINATGTITTDVENVETSNYAVLSEKNGVMVCGAEGEIVALYDMAGRMIQSIKATSDNVRINVAVPGVYVVKVNGEAIRAIVK